MYIYFPFVYFYVFLVKRTSGDDVFTNRFCDIRFGPTFIDKTLLIPEVLKHKRLFMNAPHEFGKSANIGMLNMFLSNLRTKETITEYFNGTLVWADERLVEQHMGAHPVILYNTSVCRVVHDEDHMTATFLWILHQACADHEYLLRSDRVSADNKVMLEALLDVTRVQTLGRPAALGGLAGLAQALYEHYDKPVILLADGFGQGVVERILEDNQGLMYLSHLLVQWYSSIVNQTLLEQNVISHAVFTAETRLYGLSPPVTSLFHQVDFMRTKEFSWFYGFTYDELEYLLCKFNIPLQQRPQVLKWYCNYSSEDGEVKVCNPQSILCYLKSAYKIIKVYWTGSPAGPDLLQRMVAAQAFKAHFKDLVSSRAVNITMDTDLLDEGVGALRMKVELLSPDSECFVSQLLLEVGYLTIANRPLPGVLSLRFPNEEIRSVVDKFVSLLSFI